MIESYALIVAAGLLLASIVGLVLLALSSNAARDREREDMLHILEAKDHQSAQAIIAVAQSVTKLSEELVKSNDRILAVADNRAYQSVKYQEKPKKARDRTQERVVEV
jgi:glycerol-3-phosphate O-acyltransferase